MTDDYWRGPTYSITDTGWGLTAGIANESGRLEWLLNRTEEGEETLSHSFVLDPGADLSDLEAALSDVPTEVRTALTTQVDAQNDPRLVAGAFSEGLA